MLPLVPINSLARHFSPFFSELSAAATGAIESGYYVLGPCVQGFEIEFAEYCGVSDCVGVANGTDALELSLKAVGVGPGDKVALCANAAMYATSATLACGASPLFIDVDPTDGLMSPEVLRHTLALVQTAPKAILATHLYGKLCDMEQLLTIAEEASIPLIEDCAQAHGASRGGKRAGSFGDIASFSFYPTKNLGALGDGGAVVTNTPKLASLVRQLRQYGWSGKYENSISGGRNSRLDEIQATMLSLLLPHLDSWNAARRSVATRYVREIRNPKIRLPSVGGDDHVAHLFVIQVEDRESFRAFLAEKCIQTEVHYPRPDHRQPCFGTLYADVNLPNTESACERFVTLPCFPELFDDEIQRVIQACNAY